MTTVTAERQELHHAIAHLSDKAIVQIKGYIDRVREEELEIENIKAEIAALEAKYGTTPNAETIAAIKEARAGKGKKLHSIDELMRDLHDENDD
jgi:vacuolar-type H+-ATPase subunit I/STV1